MTLWLHAMGHFHPENEISNRFLEALDIGTSDEWIVERVGIHARRTVLSLDYLRETRNADPRGAAEASHYTGAELGARAAEQALARAGIARERVGLVLSGSNAPGVLCPAEAAFVARELALEVPAYDLNSACSTFVAQLHHLSWMDPERLPDFALLVQCETLTTTVDYSDRGTAVLFGDGAAAALVSTRVPGPARIEHVAVASSPAGCEKIVIPRTGHIRQDGRAVQVFAIRKTREGYDAIRRAADGGERPLHFIGHQANLRVLEQVCNHFDIPPERHHHNVEERGNTGGASAPSVLSAQWEKWNPRDDVALSVVGGGLTWARALVRFAETPDA